MPFIIPLVIGYVVGQAGYLGGGRDCCCCCRPGPRC